MQPVPIPASGGGPWAFVAGEASGDNLGAGLLHALADRVPAARFVGVGGPRMVEAGLDAWYPSDALAVMGLAEVMRHLPRLLRLRKDLVRRFIEARPEVFVGIDSPEFNLRMARSLKLAGVPAVQYVSPQVWAWRQGRVRTIGQSVDLVLCVLPFEPAFYQSHSVKAVFVGHPLADRVPMTSDPVAARERLGLETQAPTVAILPGSRAAEVARLGPPFAATAAWLQARTPSLQFIAPMANAGARSGFEQAVQTHAPDTRMRLVDGRSQDAIAAADVVLVASGTATLETALVKRPMVVAYKVAPLTGWLLREMKLVKTAHFSQPNLLAGRELVPEFFQEQVRPEVLGPAVVGQFERPDKAELIQSFTAMHESLRCDASARAAEAICELLSSRGPRNAA